MKLEGRVLRSLASAAKNWVSAHFPSS